jgi:hypothetical protein
MLPGIKAASIEDDQTEFCGEVSQTVSALAKEILVTPI